MNMFHSESTVKCKALIERHKQ